MLSQSSIEILRNLEDFSIDVGLTYLDNEPIEGMRSEAIYMERYCLLVRADHELAGKRVRDLGGGSQQPLCLLTPDMQNRRIIDRAFRTANSKPTPRLETNSVINLCSNVHLMGLASVIPEYFLEIIGPMSDIRAVPLTDPSDRAQRWSGGGGSRSGLAAGPCRHSNARKRLEAPGGISQAQIGLGRHRPAQWCHRNNRLAWAGPLCGDAAALERLESGFGWTTAAAGTIGTGDCGGSRQQAGRADRDPASGAGGAGLHP